MNYYNQLREMESLLIRYTNANATTLKSFIAVDKDLEREFLRKVRTLDWFEWIKDAGYFDPERVEVDTSGNARFWNILDYIERVSEQVVQNPKYGKKIIDIIENLVQFSISKRRVNNYHIWWYCVKILNNIPAAVIKDDLPNDKFRIWLSVWTDHSLGSDLTISDIGEKLLPKFLANDYGPEYKHAETIIDVITEIKIGKEGRGAIGREDAVLAWHSYWIKDAFEKHSQSIGQKCSADIIFKLANKLKRALEYKQKDQYANLKVGADVYQIKVERILSDGIKPGEINFEDGHYECLVKQFSPVQLKDINEENYSWALHNTAPAIELSRFSFVGSTRTLFINAIKKKLPKKIEFVVLDEVDKKLIDIYHSLFSDYSHVWCRSLKTGPEHGEGAEDILTVILRNVLLAKCEDKREEGMEMLTAFLSDRYQFPVFRRFVLLAIDTFWEDYSGLLDKLIEIIPSILTESDFEVEMQDVFLHHNGAFAPELKKVIKKLISDVPEYYLKKDDEKMAAYWKYKWLSPLHKNPDFFELYEDARRKAEPKDGKPYEPDRSAFEGGWVTHKAPVSKEAILQMSTAELLKYLSEFKGADFRHSIFDGEPDKEGLAGVLQAAVKDEPKKFTDNFNAFIKVDYFYLNKIFRGLKEAWNAGIEIDWQSIFDFSVKYFDRDKDIIINEALKAQGEDSGGGRYIWIVEAIAELISDGSRNDARAFDPRYFDKAEKVFDLMFPLLKGEKRPDTQRDALTYALNTTLGRTVMAYVSFSLRVARATQKKQENWGRDKFERFLPIGIDGYIWLGSYLPQMKYLDNDYTVEKISYFAKLDALKFEWQMFMDGYLTGARVYKDLYVLMRANYIKALESTIFKGRADERLVEHICIGYLQLGEALSKNNEDGQPSLLWKMLDEAKTDDNRGRWEDVAGFFWSISGRRLKQEEKGDREQPSTETKNKVVAFWEWTFKEQDFVKTRLGENYPSFLSRMAELTIWLDKIDETSEKWLILCAPYIELEHRSAFFIEYLTKFDDNESIRRIGTIFTKVLETATPTFKQEEVKLIVERLYKIGDKDLATKSIANNICNTYGRRGQHFLKDLYYQNQKR